MLGACLEHAWSIALRLIDLRTDLSRLGQRTALHCRRDPLPGKSTAAKHPNPFMPGWLDAEPVPRRPSAGSVGVTPNDDAHPEHMRSLRKSATSGRLRLFFLGGNLTDRSCWTAGPSQPSDRQPAARGPLRAARRPILSEPVRLRPRRRSVKKSRILANGQNNQRDTARITASLDPSHIELRIELCEESFSKKK